MVSRDAEHPQKCNDVPRHLSTVSRDMTGRPPVGIEPATQGLVRPGDPGQVRDAVDSRDPNQHAVQLARPERGPHRLPGRPACPLSPLRGRCLAGNSYRPAHGRTLNRRWHRSRTSAAGTVAAVRRRPVGARTRPRLTGPRDARHRRGPKLGMSGARVGRYHDFALARWWLPPAPFQVPLQPALANQLSS